MATKKVKTPITITMPKAVRRKWLAALRSGKYTQATGTLYDPTIDGFCCLGVLQHCVTGGMVEGTEQKGYKDLPSKKWINENGITFTNAFGEKNNNPDLSFEFDEEDGSLAYGNSASEHNDTFSDNFEKIANLIQKCSKGY